MIEIPYCLSGRGVAPQKATEGSTGWDLFASLEVFVKPTFNTNIVSAVPTHLQIASPPGIAWQIRGRSGLASRGVWCHPGTIDQDYRGEILVLMVNFRSDIYRIAEGERIAQLVLEGDPFQPISWRQVDRKTFERLTTERGIGGFGSTGR